MHMRPALDFAVLLSAACLALFTGGSPRAAERPVPSSAADTLANGLPRALIPKLATWVQIWRHASPRFAAGSLTHGAQTPFRLGYSWAGSAGGIEGGVRARALVDVLSPDSTRSLDFDMYLDFVRDEDGRISMSREPDSAPVLADFRSDTLWQVSFCGPACWFDGAYWVDAESFALTGATLSGPYEDRMWRGFLDIYDLPTGRSTRWVTRPIDAAQLHRYQAARHSALVERLERAGLGSGDDPATGSRLRFAKP